MDGVAALAASFVSSKIQSLPATSSFRGLILLRGLLLLLLHALLRLLLLPARAAAAAAAEDGDAAPAGSAAAAARALSHVLTAVSRVAVASRKYEMVRGLAERILDDNLCLGGGRGLDALNRAALGAAFAGTLCRLEAAACPAPAVRPVDLVAGAVRAGLRRWGPPAAAEKAEGEGRSAEKMAAEALWLAGKMEECGGAAEAVGRWGAAAGLARAALAAEPRLQVALVRVTAFLFKHVNAKLVDWQKGGEDEELEQERALACRRMAMLTSWLPLLCCASNGTDAPILSSSERTEMVRVLEDTIEKLSWDEQEAVLALWLHHFTSCSSSDWPNLESCYTRWYAESRKLLLK